MYADVTLARKVVTNMTALDMRLYILRIWCIIKDMNPWIRGAAAAGAAASAATVCAVYLLRNDRGWEGVSHSPICTRCGTMWYI